MTQANRRPGDFRTALGRQALGLAVVSIGLVASAIGPARAANDDEAVRRATAVTLNYCRASFHRIQRSPTLRVLIEEQEKILNNLDLNGIADQEVVKLYTGVLVEISEIRLANRERHVIQDRYQATLGTALTADAFDFGTQLASAHYLAAVRTGARSWWDYRNISTIRESDVFHVDRQRLMAFTEKSAQFLDTFWKLARDRKIPDRWLVRSPDLAKLDAAMQEANLSVRLRVLKRMEDFMSCYPPYWYYVARTEQALGQLPAAAETYDRLLRIGHGHFRKDDMLAAGLANRAMILDFLRRPGAAEAALKALGYSTDAWEANLMCAHVLGKTGRIAEAEDAILRNLDVGLEREQSEVALVSLYTLAGNADKLRDRLRNPAIVRQVPIPVLLRAAALLGPKRLPDAVSAHFAASLNARYDLNFGPDDFVLVTTPQWRLQSSEMSLQVGDDSFQQSTIALLAGRSEVRFAKIGEVGHPLGAAARRRQVTLTVKFPGTPMVRLMLDPPGDGVANSSGSGGFGVADLFASSSFSPRRQNLTVARVEIGESVFAVAGRGNGESIESGASLESRTVDAPALPKVDADRPSAQPKVPGPAPPSNQPAVSKTTVTQPKVQPTSNAPPATQARSSDPLPTPLTQPSALEGPLLVP